MAAASNSSVQTNPEYYTSTDSIQCCTELTSTASSEMVQVTNQIVKLDDKQSKLIIGIDNFIHSNHSNSELVTK